MFGSSGVGKSTLIDSMNCSYLNSFFRKTRLITQSKKSKSKEFILYYRFSQL